MPGKIRCWELCLSQDRFFNDDKNDENIIFSELRFESIFVTGALQGSSWGVQRRSVTLIAEKQRHWMSMPGLKVILLHWYFGALLVVRNSCFLRKSELGL